MKVNSILLLLSPQGLWEYLDKLHDQFVTAIEKHVIADLA
jgi:hypothetical protein